MAPAFGPRGSTVKRNTPGSNSENDGSSGAAPGVREFEAYRGSPSGKAKVLSSSGLITLVGSAVCNRLAAVLSRCVTDTDSGFPIPHLPSRGLCGIYFTRQLTTLFLA